MSSKLGSKPRKTPVSVSSSTMSPSSSLKQHYGVNNPIDSQISPASSSQLTSTTPEDGNGNQYLCSDTEQSVENVTVTVRFRPLSQKEVRQGEEIAWYADGENIVRSEHNPSIAYAYDRVFGPTTTTRHVYDVAAQHVVSGSMKGINGTIFAYGVTSSGKTHTMHGNQKSPGITPLAIKDAFSIIQETPSREFLLRISYIEIYNEVVNDLLNPAGQNLRIREDHQGIFVEGVKEEVVLSPAHALSLIAAGEEHRHVGSTNFNLVSSRSHSIFTLTIESSPCGEFNEGEAVNLSQLHLIDLAGSESSKAETIGVRRKEGSYINKSLLTLGTVISKLTEGRTAHIPYRDSKLTRLLQSSLSGHGRVSLICTVTPASRNAEETHSTLKFAHRAKHIEIQAAQNKIIDEKSLIKKYQNEIHLLKEELEQLKNVVSVPQHNASEGENIVHPKQKLEDVQYKMQSQLEQEEQDKAALLSRIQRLTQLILVSTKSSGSSRFPHRSGPRRRHSFGEEELAYLPHKRRDLILDDENIDMYIAQAGIEEISDDIMKQEKKPRKNRLLNWIKHQKRDGSLGTFNDKSSVVKSSSTNTPSTPHAESVNFHAESRVSQSLITEQVGSTEHSPVARSDREMPDDQFFGRKTSLSCQCEKLQAEIICLRQQLSTVLELKNANPTIGESHQLGSYQSSVGGIDLSKDHTSLKDTSDKLLLRVQASEIEVLKEQVIDLTETNDQLERRNKKLAEESTYATGLAYAAAEELKALSEKVTKLMRQNETLSTELTALKNSSAGSKTVCPPRTGKGENQIKPNDQSPSLLDLKKELDVSKEREMAYEAALQEKDQRELLLQAKVDESKRREAFLENELANLWVLVSKLKLSEELTDPSEMPRQSKITDN
ncbi:hypothetical protein vseg_014426 [Gypsophila vaccaria]